MNLETLQVLPCRGGKELRVIDQVAGKWEKLAIALGFDAALLEVIERDSHKSETACRNMLGRWLRGEAKIHVSWSALLKGLRDGGFETLALELEQAL